MPNITNIPAPRVPLIDKNTGVMTREWYRFFLNIFTLTGKGQSDTTISDLQMVPAPPQLGTIATQNYKKVKIRGGTISGLSSPLPSASGGTDNSSYSIGDILYASATTTLSKLADVATGNALISGGVTTAPLWGKIGLTTHVNGVLPVANGGTDISSYTVGDLVYASAATTLSKLADVATGNALISGGVATAPLWGKIGLTTHISGVLPVANGGTNTNSASIAAFNNITGYSASGVSGTTSTNLVFSTSPVLTTPKVTTTIGVGNTTAASSGAGVSFPSSQSASTDPNTLDDYREGTYTPSDTSGAALSITVNGTPAYSKCGTIATVLLDITYPVTADASLTSISLPFTATGSTNGVGSIGYTDYGNNLHVQTTGGGSNFRFLDDSGTFLTNANMSGKRATISFTYVTT